MLLLLLLFITVVIAAVYINVHFTLQDREAHLKAKQSALQADGEKIHSLIKENMDHLSSQEDSEDWKRYVEYLDDLVLDGFFDCILCSLQYFKENMDKEANAEKMRPLLEAKFELQVDKEMNNISNKIRNLTCNCKYSYCFFPY